MPLAGSSSSSDAPGGLYQRLTLQSVHLDLQSPAGQYSLELSHPATAVVVGRLLELRAQLEEAVAAGRAADVGLRITDVSVNGRPLKLEQLASLDAWSEVGVTLQTRTRCTGMEASNRPTQIADYHCNI